MDEPLITASHPLDGEMLSGIAGAVELSVIAPVRITSLAPFAGAAEAVDRQVQDRFGIPLPAIGASARKGPVEIVWSQAGQWFLFGADVVLDGAAMTDQSDGWVGISLKGPEVPAIMARLCPLDLSKLGPGRVARSECAHVMALIIGREGGVDLYVMRSLARDVLNHLRKSIGVVAAILPKTSI